MGGGSVGGGLVRGDDGDLAAVVDVEGRGADGAGPVDRGEAAPWHRAGTPRPSGRWRTAEAEAHDLALVVDAEGKGGLGAGDPEGGEPAPVQHEPDRASAGPACPVIWPRLLIPLAMALDWPGTSIVLKRPRSHT